MLRKACSEASFRRLCDAIDRYDEQVQAFRLSVMDNEMNIEQGEELEIIGVEQGKDHSQGERRRPAF